MNDEVFKNCRRSGLRVTTAAILLFLLVFASGIYIHYLNPTEKSAEKEAVKPEISLRRVSHVVKSGDTFASIFSSIGIKPVDSRGLLKALKSVFNVKRLNIGDVIEFGFDDDNNLVEYVYKASPVEIIKAERVGEEYKIEKVEIPVETRVDRLNVELKSSLYNAFLNIGENPVLIDKIVDIYAWDIDFYADPRKGDKVSLLVEKNYVDGKFYKYGRILIADYEGGIIKQKACYYDAENGDKAYYDEKGMSLARNFLKSPVKFTRVSSRFGMRNHPITHRLKKHLGTDYAAPIGTSVWAMADGVVTKKTYGKSNGNYIAIRHGKNYETYYLHLSRFYPGVEVGKRVRQKDLIGYVGTTGLSTGPHLHLGIRHQGKFINPLKVKKVKETSLTGTDLDKFKIEFAFRYSELSDEGDELISLPDPVTDMYRFE